MSLQIRRGPTVDRLTITPVSGELIYDTTEQKLYIGDGATPGGTPASDFTVTDAQVAAAGLITAGNYTNLSFSYNAGTNELSGELDLSVYAGTIQATSFTGSVISNDETVLVDAISAGINLDGTVKGNIVPSVNVSYDIGSPSFRFRDLYLSGSSVHLGDAIITSSGTSVNLPLGSTVGGLPIGGGGSGLVEGGNYRINIVGLDSTTIVDSNTNTVTAAQFNGNLVGSVTGILNGDVIGNVFGGIIGADGSTFIINPFNNSVNVTDVFGNLTGNVLGNLTGDVLGNVQGNLIGNVQGDVTGNIFGGVIGADGSTFLVNPFTNSVNVTDVFGNLTGNVLGDVTGNLLGNVTGTVNGTVLGELKGSVFADDSSLVIDGIDGTFHGKLGADLDVNGFRIVGSQAVLAPTGRTIIGSASLLRNGMFCVVRPFFYGDSGIYAGARTDGRSGFLYASHHNSVGVDRMVLYRTRRDEVTNTYTPVLSGDQVGELNFTALSATTAELALLGKVESDTTASIRVVVDGAPSGANAPGRIEFRTNTGTANTLQARLNKNGVFAVNTLSGLTSTLTVSGNLNITGFITGDIKGSVFANDSSMVINGATGEIPGYVSKSTLKSIAAASATYADFQAAIALL